MAQSISGKKETPRGGIVEKKEIIKKILAIEAEQERRAKSPLSAYNAGEGTVRLWLKDGRYSADGVTLDSIPYSETRQYLKKISLFRKIYGFFPQ